MNLHDRITALKVPVVCLTLEGKLIGKYGDMEIAAQKTGVHTTGILNCIKGLMIQTGGYLFLKAENYTDGMKITYASLKRKRAFLKTKK